MRKNRIVAWFKKPRTPWQKAKLGLELAFLQLALLVVVMPFTGMDTFARGNDSNRAFAGILNLSVLQDVGNSPAQQQQMEQVVEQVLETIPEDATDVQKVKLVHDYLVKNTIYDYHNYLNQSVPKIAYTPYGALVQKSAVCQGYSEAFQILMEELGIPCKFLASESMRHAWNMVQIDGEWYHVDVTWDDPVPDLGEYVSYECFLLSDAAIQEEDRAHSGWVVKNDDGSTEEAPAATSTKYDHWTDRDWNYQ